MAKKGKEKKSKKKEGIFISSGLSIGLPELSYMKNISAIDWVSKLAQSHLDIASKLPNFPNSFLETNNKLLNPFKPFMATAMVHAGIARNFMPISEQLQTALAGVQNDSIRSITKSLQALTLNVESSNITKSMQKMALFPNIGTNIIQKAYWKNFKREDKDLDEVAEILDEVKVGRAPTEAKLDRLIELAQQSVLEQQKNNELLKEAESRDETKGQVNELREKARDLREKAGLLMTLLALLLTIYTVFKPDSEPVENPQIQANEKKLEELGALVQILIANDRETTANLRLRSEPNTGLDSEIILIIPRGDMVTIVKNVNYWTYVTYTESETGELRAGWVSKRYLK